MTLTRRPWGGCSLTRMANQATPHPASPATGRDEGWWNWDACKYGIKFGLAGTLAFFIALYIRLDNPIWCVITTFVLMVAQYVGAVAEKALFRFIGTIIGGVIGYVLTGSLEQNPVIYLLLLGLIVGTCTAMIGQSRYPYAFMLAGLTTAVVAGNGFGNPDFSWKYMLWRIEEVSLGIAVTVVIQSTLWPRFARLEFIANVQKVFRDLHQCFCNSSRILLEGPNPSALARIRVFPERITALRTLLDFGSKESSAFRKRLPIYFDVTTGLSRIGNAIATLTHTLPEDSKYRPFLTTSLEALHRAIGLALEDLGHPATTTESRRQAREAIHAALGQFEAAVAALRKDVALQSVTAEEALEVGLHGLAMDSVQGQIEHIHELVDSLPIEPRYSRQEIQALLPPLPPPFWIKAGVKSAIATILAMIIADWLHPPGQSMFILGAWVFTALNAASPGGRGDMRAFHYVIYTTFSMATLCILLLFSTPMMASYAVTNVLLFTSMFLWGYLTYTVRGMTIPMQMALLCVVGVLGLNAQKPVQFQAIADLFFGIVLAMILSAVVQRLLWPSLPQFEIRNRVLEFIKLCQKILREGPASFALWERARMTLIPSEIAQRSANLAPSICPSGEKERLSAYIATLQFCGSHMLAVSGNLIKMLPAQFAEEAARQTSHIEGLWKIHLEAHTQSFLSANPAPADPTPLTAAMEEWTQWVTKYRLWMLDNDYPIIDAFRILGYCALYIETTREVLNADHQLAGLQLKLYMGDYSL